MKKLLFNALALIAVVVFSGCSRDQGTPHVVLYTSQDQFYAEPILKEFSRTTGIEVRPVFDTESAKTAGLAHRLRAERANPQCDVFWSNEEMHTRLLVRDQIIGPQDWKAAGARTRCLIANSNRLFTVRTPKSLLELTNSAWNGRVALAYPLFGTTHSHFLALRQLWGEDLWRSWCYGLVRNGAKVVDGNSVVVKLVGQGECWFGLTDSDDVAAGLHEGLPIATLPTVGECIVIPNTIATIRGAPHPSTAKALVNFLLKGETLDRLVSLGALQSVETQGMPTDFLPVNWDEALREANAASEFLELIFVRS